MEESSIITELETWSQSDTDALRNIVFEHGGRVGEREVMETLREINISKTLQQVL